MSREKRTQLTSTVRRVMGLPCFYCKLAQFKNLEENVLLKCEETLSILFTFSQINNC